MSARSQAAVGKPPREAEAHGRLRGRFEFARYSAGVVRPAILSHLGGDVLTPAQIRHVERGRLSLAAFDRIRGVVSDAAARSLILARPEVVRRSVAQNLVVDEGLDDVLDKYLKGSAYTAAHYVGLLGATPTPAAGWVMASHGTEITNYDEAARQTYTPGTVASQSVDNSASKAVVTASSGGFTAGGAFLTTNSTKGGTSGTMFCAVAFTGGNETLAVAETLTVTYTITAADDGA